MGPKRSLLGAALALALLALGATPAVAQEKAAAEALFAEGRKLMEAGDYSAACEKFASSQRLDPALGTLLNLATCYQKVGRVASAWARFVEAADLAKRAGDDRREAYARKQAKALVGRLPKVRIVVTEPVDGLAVERNGEPVDRGAFDTPLPVDPGPVTVTGRAPGYRDVTVEVTAAEGVEVRAELPPLDKLPEPVDQPDSSRGGTAPTELDRPRDHAPDGSRRTRRLVGLGLGAGGLALLGTGVGFGLAAKHKWDAAFDDGHCDPDTNICSELGQTRTDTARSRATLATIFSVAGGAALATGVVLYLISGDDGAERRLSVTPTAGRSGVGVVLGGSF